MQALQMAQTKRRSISHVCGLRSAAEKRKDDKQVDNVDDFTINLVITVIVLFIGLALVGGAND